MSKLDVPSDRLKAVKATRKAATTARDEARASKCVGPRYPGRPEDYSYSVSERCVPKGAAAAAAKLRDIKISMVATRAELARLRKLINDLSRDEEDLDLSGVHGNHVHNAIAVGQIMGKKAMRKGHPDFVERFRVAVRSLPGIKSPSKIPMILSLMTLQAHLALLVE
jgi:small ligand-binding sensory domain FIST